MVKAVESQGVVISVADGGSPTGAFTTINNVTDFSGPGGQASVIDVSNLASSRREKLMGLPDEGQFGLTLNWDPDDSGHQVLQTYRNARTRAEFKVVLTDATPKTGLFFGYVLGIVLSGSVDNAIKAAVSIEIDGAISWS